MKFETSDLRQRIHHIDGVLTVIELAQPQEPNVYRVIKFIDNHMALFQLTANGYMIVAAAFRLI